PRPSPPSRWPGRAATDGWLAGPDGRAAARPRRTAASAGRPRWAAGRRRSDRRRAPRLIALPYGGLWHDALDQREQAHGGKRLGQIVIGPRGETARHVRHLGGGGQHDDLGRGEPRIGPEPRADLEPADVRQLDVEEDQIG